MAVKRILEGLSERDLHWIKHQVKMLAGFQGPKNVLEAYYHHDHFPKLEGDQQFWYHLGLITGWCVAKDCAFEALAEELGYE